MIAHYRYQGRSGVTRGQGEARVAFATNTLREPTYFHGQLGRPLLFREALAALHAVVVSDWKYRPVDRPEYKAYLERLDRRFLASLGVQSQQARQRIEQLEARLGELDLAREARLRPFHAARTEYIKYACAHEYELSYIFDPVITVHPDEVSFEAFSRDESTYARLAAKYELFDRIDEYLCGTTNIDFSIRLHRELERMRSYRSTRFRIDPSGFAVFTGEGEGHCEKKIDLPESWVRGFLQVHAAMSLGLIRVRLAPTDLFNVVRTIRRRKAKVSPRALCYELEPGKRARAVLEPWGESFEFAPGSEFEGSKPIRVRTWGRDRLRALARLLPACRSVDVYLAGMGLPSFYVLDLGPLQFTLGLSGWTDNDWTGGASFELLARRLDVTPASLQVAYDSLRQSRFATDSGLSQATGLGLEATRSALSGLCRAGRAMYDLAGGVHRHRDLFADPFSADAAVKQLRVPAPKVAPATVGPGTAPIAPEIAAEAIVADDAIRIIARRPVAGGYKLSGSARGADGKRVRPLLHVSTDGKIVDGSCTCTFYGKHRLTQGPCQHMLALRLAHMDRLEGGALA
ncbi:MAG: hypothetical protein U0800_25090 [Isosphaeraceae bacterium]